jgi:asparagine synthase (glutamine-hydrolysing)
MCGIAGCIIKRGVPEPAALAQAAAQLQHRGPDDQGVHIAGPVGLGHTRLSVIDLAGGHQPICSLDGRYALVANGEIYNHVELRAALQGLGCVFQTESDSEAILHAWDRYALDGVRQLHGMFAFALHDMAAGELVLGRDRLGIKPLFYAVLPDRVVFGSEIKALLPLMPARPGICPEALLQFLQNQFSSGRDTVFTGIQRLLPGECLRIDYALNTSLCRYWSALNIRPRAIGEAEALEELEPLMQQVTREHMRSDVPFGLFLSGGVDSAILLAMLNEHMQGPLHTYSVGFANARMQDELRPAARIAAHFDSRHKELRLGREQILGRLVHSTWAGDDLMRDYANLPTSLLAERAAQDVKVVFSGEGGDEGFAGYRRYRPNLETRLKALLHPGSGGFRTRGQWRGRRAQRVFGPGLQAAAGARRKPFIAAWQAAPEDWSYLQKAQYTDLTTALPDNLLVKTDRMLMGFGLEGRVPFVDHRLVEFGLSLPDHLKLRGGQGKWLLKRWAERRLPKSHLDGPKRGFHVPIGEWLQGSLLDGLRQKLPANAAIRDWFDGEGVGQLIAAHAGHGGAAREIWCLLQFAIWHRLFVQQPGVRPGTDEDPLDWI